MLFQSVQTKSVALVAALALGVTIAPTSAQANQAVTRIAGSSRIETANAAATYQRTQADTVILATASDWPDAIASTALSNDEDAPLLLTGKDTIPASTLAVIRQLKAKQAIVLGGQAVVSDRVVNQLKKAGIAVERIAGAGRAETAAQIALKVGASSREQVVIAPGWGDKAWTNAIAAASLGASDAEVPTLLSATDSLPQATKDAIAALKPTTALVVGNKDVISQKVIAELENLGVHPRRVNGHNQYDISAKVLNQNWDAFEQTSTVVYASGESFADGLAAGSLAAHLDAPLVLVSKDYLGSTTTGLLRNWYSPITSGVLVGGLSATSARVESEINDVLNAGITIGEQSQTTMNDAEYQAMLSEIDVNEAPAEQPDAVAVPSEPTPVDFPTDSGEVLKTEEGIASYYTDTRVAAPGERFDGNALAAAHKTLPFGSLVRVTNLKNGKQVVVKINDRGPYIKGRVIDLTHGAARAIDMMAAGIVKVRLEVLRMGY